MLDYKIVEKIKPNDELIDIHNFQYFKKTRSYKKIVKFIDNHFDVERGSFKIINNDLLKEGHARSKKLN